MNWKQLKAVCWLRWRLSRNQFFRAGSLSAALSVVMVAVIAMCAVGAGVGGLLGGLAAGKVTDPQLLMFVCDGALGIFLFLWLIGIVTELQRSESVDIGKLMHLPVTVREVFLFNFVVSHLNPILLIFAPLLGGFCAGVTFRGGLGMLLLIPVIGAFLLAVTSWTYCLRGWLSGLMANRRRAGTIAMWMTLSMVLLGQLPNIVLQNTNKRHSKATPAATAGAKTTRAERIKHMHLFIPPGWVGYSAMSLKQGSYNEALAASAIFALLAVAGFLRGEKITRKYYSAAVSGGIAPGGRKSTNNGGDSRQPPCKRLLVAQRIPFLPDDVAGLALATLRSLVRAPETKMALLMPVIMIFAVGGSAVTRMRVQPNPTYGPFILSSALVFVCFIFAPTMSNVFGLDRGGFRSFVLSPMSRDRILFGKNLAFFPVILLLSIMVGALCIYIVPVSLAAIAAGVLQMVSGFLLFSFVSNYVSILGPYRYSMNRLKAKKFNAMTLISSLASLFLTPVLWCVLVLPAALQWAWNYMHFPAWIPMNVIASAVLLFLIWIGYKSALPHQGRLLQSRELTVLREITTELD